VLAFFSGGYFTGSRLVAGIVAWTLLAGLLVARRPRLPLAFAALALLVGWTWLSTLWAPLGAPASASVELGLLYLGALGAAFVALRGAARAVEPVLAGGVLVVIGYGIAGRVLPDLVELSRTRSAGGRLDQPLTYWNATGALAALGLVLCARLAGDRTRPLALRAAAAAGSAPLGLGVYLSYSRGALTALGVGLAVLIALAPTWPQLRAGAIALEAAALCAGVASLLPAVTAAEGDDFAAQGAILLVVLLAAMAGAAALQAWSARAEEDGTTPTGPLGARAEEDGTTPTGPPGAPGTGDRGAAERRSDARWAPPTHRIARAAVVAAVALTLAPFAAAVVDPDDEPRDPAFGATAHRFTDAGSRRFDYWEAALKGFASDPAFGRGAGGYQAIWLEERDVRERVVDAHSLELETAAELGLVGLALLALFLGAVATAAPRAGRVQPGLAAALAVYGAHSAIDWDWELPALTLVAVVLAGAILGAAADGDAELGEQRPLPG
jgi:hypothetical protein